jgi:hypothetical protein
MHRVTHGKLKLLLSLPFFLWKNQKFLRKIREISLKNGPSAKK